MARRRAFAILFLALIAAYPALMRTTKRMQRERKTDVRPDAKKALTPTVPGERGVAQQWMQKMTLRDRIAQLVIITSYGEAPSSRSAAYRDYVRAVRDLKVGGMIVVNRVVGGAVRNAEPYAMAAFLNRMQRLATVPLMVGGDFERGASMRVSGTPKYPHQMAYGAARDFTLTRNLGLATAREARALGVHWVFAPVADVNNNPDNPIINIRSFGENPTDVAGQVRAFIEGAHSDPANRVLVTVKHFPGHGDTATDSHMGLASLTANRERMQAVELAPFREAVATGVDAVMTAHMAAPAYEPEEIPATVSEKVLTGLLRQELAFGGLIVTDAMDMQGLTKQFPGGEAAVRALEAGADVLLMPPDPEAAIKAVLAAVKEGRLTSKRINESVMRVLAAKARVGLHKNRLVNLERISETIDSPESEEQAQLAADRAVTLLKNENWVLPLQNTAGACVWVLAEGRYGQQGRRFEDEVRSRAPNARLHHFDQQVSLTEMEQALAKAGQCEAHVVAAYVTVAAYRGNVALTGNYPAFLEKLQGTGSPVALAALGNPYLLRGFPWVNAYLATFSTA
ncbi:MAG TPA: glycoside hydrolase family 3 N-terminal domain-containing protein, partial [Bryobacteraceae bacterium]|nr:glycoside hydrolase family 3 N-terminal domain-containing protein [Bryobacteraceae bacterium]